MSDPAEYDEDPGTPTSLHRARPSIITTASGFAESTMTYGSLMSSDGLARLSQFPPPPPGVPITPIEAAFAGPSSPVTSDRSMTPPANARRALPVPPASPAPLNVQKRPLPSPSSSSSRSPLPDRPVDPRSGPSSPHSTAPSVHPSPYDWHDGSSSIANDPYGDAVLSTSLITSLLSSVSPNESSPAPTAGPSSFKRSKYEPSVVSNALTLDSTITYPPPKTFPPPLPSDYKYPPLPRLPASPSPGPSLDISSPHALRPLQQGFADLGGRATPETWASRESSQIGQMAGPEPSRAMSVTPSLQSMTSSTPLMGTFAKGDPILEEEEPKISGPSTPSQSRHSRARSRRASTTYSTKSAKSYLSSLATRISHSTGDARSVMAWFRGKPLPPVPPLPDHAFREIQKAEQDLPLPELVDRAVALSSLLDKGHRPYHSMISLAQPQPEQGQQMPETEGFGDVRYTGADPTRMHAARGRKGRSGDFSQQFGRSLVIPPDPDTPTRTRRPPLTRRQKAIAALVGALLIVALIVGLAVGLTVGKKHPKHTCPGHLTGAACTLDATCACPSKSGSGQCNSLAQSVVDLIPSMNTLFNSNFTATAVSNAFFQVQGLPAGGNCAQQADVIDVAPALDANSMPNRTTWAQAALLWNFVQSENVTFANQLQSFVQDADWGSLGSSDGPVADPSSKFVKQVAGFQYDFAAQTVNAPSTTFTAQGQPTSQQIGQVNSVAQGALDRMYTYALASSTQQYYALAQYWTGSLQQKLESLTQFISIVSGSPIMLPFDATAAPGQHNISALLSNSTSNPFPPPLSCYPGLSTSQMQVIQQLETSVFGLQQASAATTFDTSCYPDRPVYGVLDILQLRLPFVDLRTGVAKQAALLTRDASVRAVVYSGEVVSALPGASSPGTPSTDPRQYGTLNHMAHVLLRYLKSIPDLGVAQELVRFILTVPALPPDNGAYPTLFSSLSTLPVLEVAVFGTVNPSDIASTVSSYSDPRNSLFFGTDASLAVRDWAIVATGNGLEWADLATAKNVVLDNSFDNVNFNVIFDESWAFFHAPTPSIVNVGNITKAFTDVQLSSPHPLIPS